MKAQLYDDGMCRVFGRDQHIICDVYATAGDKTGEADAALKRARMRRVGKWKHYREADFREASVRFDSPRRRVAA